MRNTLFLGVLVAGVLLLTAALAFAIVSQDASASEQVIGNSMDNSLGNANSPGPVLTTMKTGDLVMITNDHGSGAYLDMMVYRPAKVDEGWYMIGDLVEPAYREPTRQVTLVYANDSSAVAPPVRWMCIWTDRGSSAYYDMSIWTPVPPAGYVSLGCVAVQGHNAPVIPEFRCVRADLCTKGAESSVLWSDKGGHASRDVMLWSITPADGTGLDASTFWARGNYDLNPKDTVYCLNQAKLV